MFLGGWMEVKAVLGLLTAIKKDKSMKKIKDRNEKKLKAPK
jgi:hypothetical protein